MKYMAQKIFQGHTVEHGFVTVDIKTTRRGTGFLVRRLSDDRVLDMFSTDIKGSEARKAFRRDGKLTFNWMRTNTEAHYAHKQAEVRARHRRASS